MKLKCHIECQAVSTTASTFFAVCATVDPLLQIRGGIHIICCGYSLEVHVSNEYPQHIFHGEIRCFSQRYILLEKSTLSGAM